VETILANAPLHEQTLLGYMDIKTTRIARNHRQLLTVFDVPSHVITLTDK
jgi:hypothetical protein